MSSDELVLSFDKFEWIASGGQLLLKAHNRDVPVVFAVDVEVIEDHFPDVSGEEQALASEAVLHTVKSAATLHYGNPVMRRNHEGRIVLDADAIAKSL